MLEKAHLVVKVNVLKLINVVDFSSMSFKEVDSLDPEVSAFLNQDNRLDINKPCKICPDSELVKS